MGYNPLPDMSILGSSNLAANKDTCLMSKIGTNGSTVIWLCRNHCGSRRYCSLRAISPSPTMFSKAVVDASKMSVYGVKGYFPVLIPLVPLKTCRQ